MESFALKWIRLLSLLVDNYWMYFCEIVKILFMVIFMVPKFNWENL